MHPRPHWRGHMPPRPDRVSSVSPAPYFPVLPLALDGGKFLNPFLEVGRKYKRSAATFHRTQFTCLNRLIQGSFASARRSARLGDGVGQGIHGYVSQRRGGPANRAHNTANAGELGHSLPARNRRHKKTSVTISRRLARATAEIP